MGRHRPEFHEDPENKDYHSGCIWRIILHVVNYHRRYNSKRMLLHKKRRGLRLLRWCTNTKTISIAHGSVEAQVLQKDKAGHVKQHITSSGAAFKKEKHRKLYAQSQLRETNSVHHLDPSGNVSSWKKLIVLIHKKSGSSGGRSMNSSPTKIMGKPVSGIRESNSQQGLTADNDWRFESHAMLQEMFGRMTEISTNNNVVSKNLRRAISDQSVKKPVDVMEIFKDNKELFLDIMQDSALGIRKHFPEKRSSNTTEKLTKSGSFPLPNSFDRRYLRPTTLEHKQYEIWSFGKGDKSLDVLLSKSMALRTDDCVGRTKTEEKKLSSPESHHLAWSLLLVNLFKDIKQRFKYAIKEKKLGSKHTKSDGLPTEVPSVHTRPKETNMAQVSTSGHSNGQQSDASGCDLENRRLHRVRRTASLNESLDKYAKLIEKSASRDANLSHSRSLRMRNEDKLSSRKHTPKFFRRISSLSELESFVSFLNEVSRGDPWSKMPVGVAESTSIANNGDEQKEQKTINIPVDTKKMEPTEAILNNEFQGVIVEANDQNSAGSSSNTIDEGMDKPVDFDKDLAEPEIWKNNHHWEHMNELDTGRELVELSSDCVHNGNSTLDISSTKQQPILEGCDSNALKLHEDKADSSFISQEGHSPHSFINNDFQGPESDRDQDACFNYVRDVLELSGFVGNEYLTIWHSPDQPLSPSLFKELETWSPEEISSKCDNQLLFDLVNESLLDIYDCSPVYFPRGFSFSSGICQIPESKKLLTQVWENVSKELDYVPKQDQSLDDIVGRDFVKDSWTYHQLDAECWALDLEDLIFDELLDQVIFM